jgi:hypothetical protein
MDELVCSVCGSQRYGPVQRSMDDRWPIAHCSGHQDKRTFYAPLVSKAEFAKRPPRPSAEPEDLFGQLPDDERDALTRPVRIVPLGA